MCEEKREGGAPQRRLETVAARVCSAALSHARQPRRRPHQSLCAHDALWAHSAPEGRAAGRGPARAELVPVLAALIQEHRGPAARDALAHTLFNLVKRPAPGQRRMILAAWADLAAAIGHARTAEELLPQCWEQVGARRQRGKTCLGYLRVWSPASRSQLSTPRESTERCVACAA